MCGEIACDIATRHALCRVAAGMTVTDAAAAVGRHRVTVSRAYNTAEGRAYVAGVSRRLEDGFVAAVVRRELWGPSAFPDCDPLRE